MEGSWLADDLSAGQARGGRDGAAKWQGFSGVTGAWRWVPGRKSIRWWKQAVGAGARLMKPPREVFWGGYSGYFADRRTSVGVAFNPFTDLT